MGFFNGITWKDITAKGYSGNVRATVKLGWLGFRFREAQIWLDRQIMLDMQPYIAFKTGKLQGAITTRNNVYAGTGQVLIYTLPYGRRIYYGWTPSGRPMNYSNPLTTPRWFDTVKARYMNVWERGCRDIILGRKKV